MNKYAKEHWIPVDISIPDSNRVVQLQLEEYPDPTIGCYWAEKGIWTIEQKGSYHITDFTPIAWRELADPFVEEDDVLIFRRADEARTSSFNALKRIRKGHPHIEFYEVREKILERTIHGEFTLSLQKLSDEIKEKLVDAGFEVSYDYKSDKYIVSWE